MNAPYPGKERFVRCVTIAICCVYFILAFYWALRLGITFFEIFSFSDDLQREGPLYVALALLNVAVMALFAALAGKTFRGKAALGLFMFVAIVAMAGTTWLNSMVHMLSF